MKQMVSLKLLLITLILSGTLIGCSNNATQHSYELDYFTLGHSAVFTQRELINSLLEDSTDSEETSPDPLLNSYCVLIDRRTIYVTEENIPQQCNDWAINHKTRSCAKQFHKCVKMCSLRSNDCQPCIGPSKECLE